MVSLVFFVDFIFPTSLESWVGSASKSNEYQEYFLGSKGGRWDNLTSCCVDRLEIWESQLPETLRKCQGPIQLPLYRNRKAAGSITDEVIGIFLTIIPAAIWP